MQRAVPEGTALFYANYSNCIALASVELIQLLLDPFRVALKAEYQSSIDSLQWIGLEVIESFQGGESDKTGKVSFKASYLQTGQRAVHYEKSRFKRHGGRWYYLDGEIQNEVRS